MPIIAPSLLSANFANLEKDIQMISNSEAEWLHIDVMDGNFVPNISFGFPIINAVRPLTNLFFDVHLMIEKPERYAEEFKKSGADGLTVHAEACNHLHRNIQQIKSLGMKAGVSLNPHTSISVLENVIEELDLVLLMSVNPGFGGQKFIHKTLEKIRQVRQLITDSGSRALIEVDGGVTLDNAPELIRMGVDVLVAGNTVFTSSDPSKTIFDLKNVNS